MRRKGLLRNLATERANPASVDLDRKSALEIARIINAEDAKVARAVKRALPEIAKGIDLVAAALARGGRVIYVGTGTSGRIAALDAAEIPPTFDLDHDKVQFVMAGGTRALAVAVEANEDSRAMGRRDMAKRKPSKKDVVVGVAASGRTPFTVAAIEYARSQGARTIALTNNRNSPLKSAAEVAIVAVVGPEVLTGSTRMKAGTAQKMILNMLSTGAMARLGYVYGNLMVNVPLKNQKLGERALVVIERGAGISRRQARKLLAAAGRSVPVALVMAKAGVTRARASAALEDTEGNVRKAIAAARAGPR
jgi:N-acetylmuramic acid 6-phosphate etherase